MVQDLGGVILENLSKCSFHAAWLPYLQKCIKENKIILLSFRSKFFFFLKRLTVY